jgi:cytochrome P450
MPEPDRDAREVPDLPRHRSHPLRPPDGMAALARRPVRRVRFPNGVDAWLATGLDEARLVLSDPRFGAHRDGREPALRADPLVSMNVPANFNIKDGEAHRHYQRPLSRGFMTRRIEALRPRIQRITDEHLDAMEQAGPPVDLVTALCVPVPSLVIAELLGVPVEHQPLVGRFARALVGLTSSQDDYRALARELSAVVAGLVAAKRADGGTEDLLGMLANDPDPFPDEELVFLGTGLLAAGQETTTNAIGLCVLALLEHPKQRALFSADNADTAVEELLRWLAPVGAGSLLPRRALVDLELGGELVRAGDWVAASPYANLDPAMCPHATELDVTRPYTDHLAFSHGPHQCLGQSLARAELQIMLTSLLARFPALALDRPLDSLRYRTDMLVYGVHELPVRW